MQIEEKTKELLSKYIVVANNAAFLWRKLSNSPIVNVLAYTNPELLLNKLENLLKIDLVSEEDEIEVYCYAVALILNNRLMANKIVSLKNIEKFIWLKPLSNHVLRSYSSTSIKEVTQGPIFSVAETTMKMNTSKKIITI